MHNNDWSSSHSYQFWNKNFTSAVGLSNEVTLKTIYSPSPSGFVEPKTAAFTGFTSSGSNENNTNNMNITENWNEGWNIYTIGWKTGPKIFFKALGSRNDYDSGNITDYGRDGHCWTVGANSTYAALYLGYSSTSNGYINPQSVYFRHLAFAIRPVKNN